MPRNKRNRVKLTAALLARVRELLEVEGSFMPRSSVRHLRQLEERLIRRLARQ